MKYNHVLHVSYTHEDEVATVDVLLLGHCEGTTHLLRSSSTTIPCGQPHPLTHTAGHGVARS